MLFTDSKQPNKLIERFVFVKVGNNINILKDVKIMRSGQ
jgi:hypothetical protein